MTPTASAQTPAFTRLSLHVRIASLVIVLAGGVALSVVGISSLADGPGPQVLGSGSDFSAGPIHGGGAATQWITARAPVIAAISFRPVPPSSPDDLGINVRVIDTSSQILTESQESLASIGSDGWLIARFAPLAVTLGAEYGIQFSTRRPDGEFLYLDASNFQPIGPGLEINGNRQPSASARLMIAEPPDFRSSVRVLRSTVEHSPAAVVAVAVGLVLAIYAMATLARRLVLPSDPRSVRVLSAIAGTAVVIGLPLAAAGLMIG